MVIGVGAENTTHPRKRNSQNQHGIGFASVERVGTGINPNQGRREKSTSITVYPGCSNDPPQFSLSNAADAGNSGQLALVCIETALQMGFITKFMLCPQGKARRHLVSKTKTMWERQGWSESTDGTRKDYWAQDVFLKHQYSGIDVLGDEEYSSGDDDDFDSSIMDHGSEQRSFIPSNKEPLFIPTETDATSIGLQGGQATAPGIGSLKIPFNFRKVRYFDSITASSRTIARQFLRQEIVTDEKKIRSQALSEHFKTTHLQGKEKDAENKYACGDHVVGEENFKSGKTTFRTVFQRFSNDLTPTLSAALLIESLALNRHESIEGMARCYDGIVSAGTALLDLANDTLHDGGKTKLKTSEIMGALIPLLITTLGQTSGQVLVELSKLRNYCGTRRYQHRFVQRIAPFLVRPPDAAIWCIRHQRDIEPIIAAVEMILDNAFEIFSAGWFERGAIMLKDTQRAESLRTAASQLRRLNSPSPSDCGGLLTGLSAPGSQLHRCIGGKKKDGRMITNDSLTDWEVAAVDGSIHRSILALILSDWSRISTLNLSPRENETPFGSRPWRGVTSTVKSKEYPVTGSSNQRNRQKGGRSPSQTKSSSKYQNSLPDVSMMSLAELQQRKRELKQQLQSYDTNFHAQNGRMPEKRDKEPIRHLYESYNAYKNQISTIERGEAEPGPFTAAFQGVADTKVDILLRTTSSRLGQRGDSNVEMEMIPGTGSSNQRNKQNGRRSLSQTKSSSKYRNSLPDVSMMSLAELQQRKRELKQQLQIYNTNFHAQHGRMPEKRDREPMRHLYESYSGYKNQISAIGRGEAEPGPGTAAFQGVADTKVDIIR